MLAVEEPLDDPEEELVKSRELLLAQQLALEQKQFERLKHDFKYNLSLLRERDAELEKYDLETATLRAELDQRAAEASKAQAEAELRDRHLVDARKKVAELTGKASDAERRERELAETLRRVAAVGAAVAGPNRGRRSRNTNATVENVAEMR